MLGCLRTGAKTGYTRKRDPWGHRMRTTEPIANDGKAAQTAQKRGPKAVGRASIGVVDGPSFTYSGSSCDGTMSGRQRDARNVTRLRARSRILVALGAGKGRGRSYAMSHCSHHSNWQRDTSRRSTRQANHKGIPRSIRWRSGTFSTVQIALVNEHGSHYANSRLIPQIIARYGITSKSFSCLFLFAGRNRFFKVGFVIVVPAR